MYSWNTHVRTESIILSKGLICHYDLERMHTGLYWFYIVIALKKINIQSLSLHEKNNEPKGIHTVSIKSRECFKFFQILFSLSLKKTHPSLNRIKFPLRSTRIRTAWCQGPPQPSVSWAAAALMAPIRAVWVCTEASAGRRSYFQTGSAGSQQQQWLWGRASPWSCE